MAFQCRLCVRKFNQREPVMLFDIKNHEVLSKIRDIIGLSLADEEHLPRHICGICQKQLTAASGFRDKCRRLQRDLLSKNRVMESRENIVPTASSRVSKGKFIQIGKQIPLPKIELIKFREVNNNGVNTKRNEAENIPPVQRHKAKAVLTKEYLICDRCGDSFKSATNLKMHNLRHRGIKDFACTSCDMRFVNPYLLKVHVQARHLGERPFACRFCERKFFTSGARSYHQQSKHIRDQSYRCDICSCVFNTKSDLNSHKYRHTNRKPFQCKVCNLSFSRRFNLKHHYNSKGHYKTATSVVDAQHVLIRDDDD